jgi:TIR domain
MSTNVFVSYSRADSSLVSPVVSLLRVNRSLVFQDIDTIQPGKRWQGEIDKALSESHLVVVFWCTHASGSNAVSKEWHAAIELKKDLLPLLLDPTPLPPELAEFQWIDFRGTVGANHSSIGSITGKAQQDQSVPPVVPPVAPVSSPPCPSWASPRLARWIAVAASLAVAALVVWFYSQTNARVTKSFPLPTPTATPFPQDWGMAANHYYFWILFWLGITFAVMMAGLFRVTKAPRKSTEDLKRRRVDIEQEIASEVEAEILRRTTLKRESGK